MKITGDSSNCNSKRAHAKIQIKATAGAGFAANPAATEEHLNGDHWPLLSVGLHVVGVAAIASREKGRRYCGDADDTGRGLKSVG